MPCDTIAATTDGDSRHPAPAAPTRLEVAIRLVLALGVAYQHGFVRRGLAGEALRTIVGVGPRSRPSTSSRTWWPNFVNDAIAGARLLFDIPQ